MNYFVSLVKIERVSQIQIDKSVSAVEFSVII